MISQNIAFGVIAAAMALAALGVVRTNNVVHAALYLVVVLAGGAAQFILLGQEFVAWVQVLVYIGAISVLVLFAIMLTQTKAGPASLVFQTQAFPAAIASALLALLIAIVVASTDWGREVALIPTSADDLAKKLFADFTLPFEVVSVLLLAAVIGGVFLAKRERGDGD